MNNEKESERIFSEMLLDVQRKYINIEGIMIKPNSLVFEERVIMNCFYCGKYGHNWMCPPNLPKINFQRMFSEYECGAFILMRSNFTKGDYEEIRSKSSITLHKALLHMEAYLWKHNNSTAISFGAGSCKLCRDGCGKAECNNPYMARSPLEATGVNVIKSAQKYNICIDFPPKNMLLRLGLLLW